MADIRERLDLLKQTIQEDDFLQGKGLSNEVNIRMFCYNPKDEMVVDHFVERLDHGQLTCQIEMVDLYETFLSICEDMEILEDIPEMEKEDGIEFLEEQLENTIDVKVFSEKIINNFSDEKDLLLLIGVGKVFPFMRVHGLLNALQENLNDKPIVVLYPGSFDGHYVKLFNQLKSNEYYRAFNMIQGEKNEDQRYVQRRY